MAFVTGAANGIGRSTAIAFAREGANVVVADISEQGNRETARMIEELGGRALSVTCNMTWGEDVRLALDKAVETFGRLDFAFNNASVEQSPAPTADITEEEWDRIISISNIMFTSSSPIGDEKHIQKSTIFANSNLAKLLGRKKGEIND